MSVPHRVDPIFGCWIFEGRRDDDGYGRVGLRKAHVVSWEQAKGPVPEGKFLDHLCKRRDCCAPHHLEPVTKSENEFRKDYSYLARRKKCPAGHDLNINAVVTKYGGRVCRSCNRIANTKTQED